MFIAVPAMALGQLMHWPGFLLNDIFFRGYRTIDIKKPVFIVGIPRSGTTLFQRVLARDIDNFTGYDLWELLFAPSITEWKFWTFLGRVDSALGGLGLRILRAIDRRAFRNLSKIHPTSLFAQEEDEPLFMALFLSAALIYPFPFPEDIQRLTRLDTEASPEEQDDAMRFYTSCIKRHLYCHGPHKHYLAKNTFSTARVATILRAFPDAHIVCHVRSPYQSIPSIMSLAAFYWRQFDNQGTLEEFRDQFLAIAHHFYAHPVEVLPKWPENQQTFIQYNELKENLQRRVTDLYSRLSLEMTPDFAEHVAAEDRKAKGFVSKHVYSMEQYALTPADISNTFGDIFDRFGFETSYRPTEK